MESTADEAFISEIAVPEEELPAPAPETSQDKNLVEQFPANEILDLAALVGAELISFKDGAIVLKQLSEENLRDLLGVNDNDESQDTGLRFKDVKGEESIESTPNFAAVSPFDKNAISDTTTGVVKISAASGEHNIDLIVQKFDLGSAGFEYSLSLIPDITMNEDIRLGYLRLVVKHLQKETGV